MWMINALFRPSHLSYSNIFYYCKKGEGGGQEVMIGVMISENVDNYGRTLKKYRCPLLQSEINQCICKKKIRPNQ